MIIMLAGGTHTGKTMLAQKLLIKYLYPYLSLDHLKMGLIRSGYTNLTPQDDEELTEYLWPVVREIIKTAIENQQNLIIEGCYIPFDWQECFEKKYLDNIKYICLILSEKYIVAKIEDINKYANVIEKRLENSYLSSEELIKENNHNKEKCEEYALEYILIENNDDFENKVRLI